MDLSNFYLLQNMPIRFLALFISIFLFFKALGKDQGLVIQSLSHIYNPIPTAQYWKTLPSNASPQAAIEAFSKQQFKSINAPIFQDFFNDDIYWFRFELNLLLPFDTLFYLTFYRHGHHYTLYEEISPQNLDLLAQGNFHQAPDLRIISGRYLHFPLHLKAYQQKTFWIRIEKTMVRNMLVRATLAEPHVWHVQNQKDWGIVMLFIGFFAFTFAFTAFLYFVFRERLYFFQAIYILSALFFSFHEFYLYADLAPDSLFPYLSKLPVTIPSYFFSFMMMLVFREFMELKQHFPILYKWSDYLIYAIVFGLGCAILSYVLYLTGAQQPWFKTVDNAIRIPTFFVYLFLIPTLIGWIIYLIPKVSQRKQYFLFSLLLFYALWGFTVLNYGGLIKFPHIPPNNLVVGMTFEIFVFTLILVLRFLQDRNDKISLLQYQISQEEQLSARIIQTQENERKYIAQELHDGLAGSMSALRMMVNYHKNNVKSYSSKQVTTTYSEVEARLDEAIKEIRDISHFLIPKDFESKKLTQMLTDHIHYIQAYHPIQIEYFFSEKVDHLPLMLQINLFRISTELLQNTLKHAEATQASLQIHLHQDILTLLMEDNGKGLKPHRQQGIGLQNIRSRVAYFKGSLNIDTNSFSTHFIIEIPAPHENTQSHSNHHRG